MAFPVDRPHMELGIDPYADPPYLVSEYVHGTSLRPLLQNPATPWDRPVLMTNSVIDPGSGYATGEIDYAVRSNDYRYIQYHAGGKELYAEGSDPNEVTSLSADPRYADVIARLAAYVPA